ncbi:oxidoreductase, partial [Klebsiella quasipneumoniae]
MSSVTLSGRGTLGDRQVYRLGYGAMQLAGPGVFGPPKDPEEAVRVLQAAVEAGVNHIDTSDFYGPHVTNQLIRKALHPYPDDLCIVTKVSARRDEKGNWLPAMSSAELTQAVEDNLRHLGLDVLEVVNLRSMLSPHGPVEGSLEAPLATLLELKARGLIRHIGLSNVTAKQVADAQKMTPIVCVQNLYNIAHRADDALVDALAAQHIAWVPFFPLGGFTPLQAQELNEVAASLEATPMQVALAWL